MYSSPEHDVETPRNQIVADLNKKYETSIVKHSPVGTEKDHKKPVHMTEI
jgi:hypothetical protein